MYLCFQTYISSMLWKYLLLSMLVSESRVTILFYLNETILFVSNRVRTFEIVAGFLA